MKITWAAGATPLDPDEMTGLLPTSISTQDELNAFEQANIVDAESWALGRKRERILTDEFMRGLHRRMFRQVWRWAGSYRTSDKNIGVSWQHIPVKVVELCLDAELWVKQSTFGWDQLAARFHHRLVSIHPFPNGNGRFARLMTDVLMFNHGQKLFTWGATSTATGETRDLYISALKAADRRDLGPLVTFVRS